MDEGADDLSGPTRNRFSRNALAAYVQERKSELSAYLHLMTARAATEELRRLYDHFGLGSDRPRKPMGKVDRYTPR